MAFSCLKLKSFTKELCSSSSPSNLKLLLLQSIRLCSSKSSSSVTSAAQDDRLGDDCNVVPTSGISRPLSEILKELNKRVPDSLIRTLPEKNGFNMRYIPWHTVNRIMNLHAPEWSGEIRSIAYSADGKSVSVVYRVTLYGTDAEVTYLLVHAQ